MEDPSPHDEIVVSHGAAGAVLVWIGFPVLGAVGGVLVKAVAGWVAGLPWAPLQGPFRLVDQATSAEPVSTIGAVLVGALAGLVVAFLAAADLLAVVVAADHVRLRRGGAEQRVDAASANAVFLDGDQLVVLGRSGEELVREKSDLPRERLAGAFRRHGYRWLDDDPFAAEFRRWVPDTPGLPSGADALLRARDTAVQKNDKDDAADLRGELARLGVVVRDEKKRQYWRLVQPQPRDGASGLAEP